MIMPSLTALFSSSDLTLSRRPGLQIVSNFTPLTFVEKNKLCNNFVLLCCPRAASATRHVLVCFFACVAFVLYLYSMM